MCSLKKKDCLECGRTVNGRADKKFCGDHCRTIYNNRVKLQSLEKVKDINSILKRNRQILEEIFQVAEKAKVKKQVLISRGFDPSYHTHIKTSKLGTEFRFCYEFGYYFDQEGVRLVRQG
jgi:hypothetical protein